MKKILLAVNFLLLAVSFISAQDGSAGNVRRETSNVKGETSGVEADTTAINMKLNNLQSQYQKISANIEEEKKLLLRIEGYVQALADQKNEMVEAEKQRIASLKEPPRVSSPLDMTARDDSHTERSRSEEKKEGGKK